MQYGKLSKETFHNLHDLLSDSISLKNANFMPLPSFSKQGLVHSFSSENESYLPGNENSYSIIKGCIPDLA